MLNIIKLRSSGSNEQLATTEQETHHYNNMQAGLYLLGYSRYYVAIFMYYFSYQCYYTGINW